MLSVNVLLLLQVIFYLVYFPAVFAYEQQKGNIILIETY